MTSPFAALDGGGCSLYLNCSHLCVKLYKQGISNVCLCVLERADEKFSRENLSELGVLD